MAAVAWRRKKEKGVSSGGNNSTGSSCQHGENYGYQQQNK
jgi:hypothetical protein